MSSFRLLLAAVVIFPVACARTSPRQAPESEPSARPGKSDPGRATEILRARLSGDEPPAAMSSPEASEPWAGLRRLYEAGGHRPLWIEKGRARSDVEALREAIRRAAEDGLDPSDYDPSALDTLLAARPAGLFRRATVPIETLVDADVRASCAFLKLALHLELGRVPPGKVDKHWFGTQRQDDPVKMLEASLRSGTVGKSLERLRPRHPQYTALQQVLARYREIAAGGGWPALPARLRLRPGRPDPQVTLLRARLAATGDLAPAGGASVESAEDVSGKGASGSDAGPAPPPPVFDEETQAALKHFERRHGLAPDGRLDAATLAALNVPVEERIRQVELNLERWRWLPETLGDRYVLVNIPTFHLVAVDGGRTELAMRVVAGKQESPTPIFSEEMTTVVFSPYWNVPPGIARNETIPAVMRDPGHVYRNNLEVVRGSRVVDPWSVDWSNPGRVQLRQRPGAGNALGGVKFFFPNRFNVYLHDTPADALFARVERDYSHGCVRVEKPLELARWALQDQPEWTPERIRAAMALGRERHVALKKKVAVFIVYETVWVDDDGTVEFREDIYGHDARQQRILPARPAAPVRVARRDAGPPAAVASATRVAHAN